MAGSSPAASARMSVDVPVIVMTAARDAADWAREVNAKGYVAKPFELDDLIRAVEGALPQSA